MATKTVFVSYNEAQAREKARERQRATGLAWDFYHTGGGWRVVLIYTRATPTDDWLAANELLSHLDGQYSLFTDLADRSGIPAGKVLSGARTLVQAGKAVVGVNRNGAAYAVRLR